jgi:protein-S-isoprenylcysteine O-methyltransferase Ste14
MEVLGKPTLNPVLFYSGKIAGYIVWTILLLSLTDITVLSKKVIWHSDIIAWVLLITGLLFSIISLFSLGRSTRFGLPTEKTVLKTRGLYKISRNPIYFGFNLITLSSIIYFINPIILVPGIYSIVVYHLIIIGEEKFLEKAFREAYLEYKKKVRRYI